LAGNAPFNTARFESEKKIENAEINALIAGELWKKEEKKKAETK